MPRILRIIGLGVMFLSFGSMARAGERAIQICNPSGDAFDYLAVDLEDGIAKTVALYHMSMSADVYQVREVMNLGEGSSYILTSTATETFGGGYSNAGILTLAQGQAYLAVKGYSYPLKCEVPRRR